MSKKYKKFKNPKNKVKCKNEISFNDMANMIQGFTDDEFEFVMKWLPELRNNKLINNK